MAYSNSPLVVTTILSPNNSGNRNHKIDTITPHCVVGHTSLKNLGNWFARSTTNASSNYGIDDHGQVGLFVPESKRSWCTSSSANDNRAVTIEIASDAQHPHAITNDAMDGLIVLMADICKRNDIPKLMWKGNKNLIGRVDQQNITVHRWFAAKACPGEYIYSRLDEIATEVNKLLIPKPIVTPVQPTVFVPYLVRITASVLNYRKGPGTNYPVAGQIKKGGVYTIIQESAGPGSSKWGKLESGAGWVSLAYCEKVR